MPEPVKMVRSDQFWTLSHDAITEQIRIRKDLMSQMLGSLYPSILRDEIVDLIELQRKSKLEIIAEAALGDE